jgi:hypothetical protein
MARGRRARPDPLLPVNEPRWLVVRNRYSQAIESRRLPPLADLRGELLVEHADRQRAGWQADDLNGVGAFFFCERGGEQCCVAIEVYAPGTAPMR